MHMDQTLSAHDKAVLRALAGEVAELAQRPIEKEKRQLWIDHNALKATRPVIFCDPENGWHEIITPSMLQCTGVLAREWEFSLRKEIFWGKSIKDDRVIQPLFDIAHCFTESDWGMHEKKIGGENGGAYHWESPLHDYKDIDLLHFPTITVDYPRTQERLALADDIFNGILTVRLHTAWWWTLGMTWTFINLRGLENLMYDMYDHPDGIHRLMQLLRDGTHAKLDFLEAQHLLCLNNDGTYVGSGGFGWSDELPSKAFKPDSIKTIDLWGFAESQETSVVSPEMFAEFIFPYQYSVLERFGLNCYGCCEAVNNRWDTIKKIPRLRRISVSPWADVADMAEKLGDRYILSRKPMPSYLALPKIDEDFIRQGLREDIQSAKKEHCRLEIIMKDTNTIGKNPNNIIRWTKIAMEEALAI